MLGGRVTLAFLGLLGIVIGGSVAAYFRFAHHRPLVVVVGSLVSVLVLMEAAYRRWDVSDRALSELKEQCARAPVGEIHERPIHEWLRELAREVGGNQLCDYFDLPDSEEHNKAAIAAHFVNVITRLDEWDQAAARAQAAPAAALERIKQAVNDADIPAGYNSRVLADVFARFLVGGAEQQGGGGGYRVLLSASKINDVWKVDTPNGLRNTHVNVSEFPDAPWEEIAKRVSEDTETLQAVVDRIRESGVLAEIAESQGALQDLQQPLLDLLALHQAVSPILSAPDCPFCRAQLQTPADPGKTIPVDLPPAPAGRQAAWPPR